MTQDQEIASLKAQVDAHQQMFNESLTTQFQLRTQVALLGKHIESLNTQIKDLVCKVQEPLTAATNLEANVE